MGSGTGGDCGKGLKGGRRGAGRDCRSDRERRDSGARNFMFAVIVADVDADT